MVIVQGSCKYLCQSIPTTMGDTFHGGEAEFIYLCFAAYEYFEIANMLRDCKLSSHVNMVNFKVV